MALQELRDALRELDAQRAALEAKAMDEDVEVEALEQLEMRLRRHPNFDREDLALVTAARTRRAEDAAQLREEARQQDQLRKAKDQLITRLGAIIEDCAALLEAEEAVLTRNPSLLRALADKQLCLQDLLAAGVRR